MSYFPCEHWTQCEPPVEGVAVRNFSAEAPDVPSFFGFYQCSTEGTNPPFANCTSITSQAAADFCASVCYPRGVYVNTLQTGVSACGVKFTAPGGMFLGVSVQAASATALAYALAAANKMCLFKNSSQFCQVTCADSSTRNYTVVANTISAATQAIADSTAMQISCETAALLCFGSLVANQEQSCEIFCATTGGTITYTISAGVVHGLSQASADERAREIACQLALLGCSELPPLIGSAQTSCSQQCLGQTVSFSVPQNAFFALTQIEADQIASVFCFLTLAQACAEEDLPPPAMNSGNSAQTCQIACAGGGTFSSTVQAGAFRLENKSAADQAAISYCNAHIYPNSFCLTDIASGGCVNTVYAAAIGTVGPGTPTAIGVISGTLPPGLSFSGGMLSGIFTTPGVYNFQIKAQDSSGNYALKDYTITVAEIVTVVLPDGDTSTPYAQAIAVSGFTNPVFTIVGGALPNPLTLHPATGVISGDAPTEDGPFNFVVMVQDANATCLQDYVLTITASTFCADMVWGAPAITPSAPVAGTGSATALECTFHLEATAPGFPDSSAGNQVVDIGGSQSYTGPAINLNLHLVVSGISGEMSNSDIVIQLDGNPLTIITNEDVNGTYDFPFTIPISVAAAFTIQVTMIANGSSGAAAGIWDGTLTVLP